MRFWRRSKMLFFTNGLGTEIWPVGSTWFDKTTGHVYLITKHRPLAMSIRVYGRRVL